jgi:hypothetical protein
MKNLSFLKSATTAGFSLAEAVVALGIGTIAIAGGMSLNSHQLRLVKSVRESNAASHALEERIEQLRIANWKQMTDPSFVTAHYFSSKPKSAHVLSGSTERLTVTAFPDESACTPLSIERDATGAIKVLSGGDGLDTQRLARVNVRVAWPSTDNKVRVRELASIISNAGINAKSLPAMGTDSGATSTTEGTTTQTESGGGTVTPTGTGTGTTAPGVTTTTTTTNNGNGNGNGQGNVAGKPGKK